MSDCLPAIDWLAPEVPVEHPEGTCRFCGCTRERACPGGCVWVDAGHTICSACHCRAQLLLILPKRRKDELAGVLAEESNPNILALAFWHARGDWRRSAIRRRIAELQKAGNKPACPAGAVGRPPLASGERAKPA